MADPDYSLAWWLFHYGIEFLQAAEILNRLHEADDFDLLSDAVANPETFYKALRATLDSLRSAAELSEKLSKAELRELRRAWSSEAKMLIGYVAKYHGTTIARNKRY